MTEGKNRWRLIHIVEAAEIVEEYLRNTSRDKFLSDYPLQCVFVRQIEIIGEAANNLTDEFRRSYPEVEWGKATGMRNRIIHGYFEVDLDILWSTLNVGVPIIKKQTEKILKEL